jgi:hypothetical protein
MGEKEGAMKRLFEIRLVFESLLAGCVVPIVYGG